MIPPLKQPDSGDFYSAAVDKQKGITVSSIPPALLQASNQVKSFHEKCIKELNLKQFKSSIKVTVETEKMAKNVPLKRTIGQKINLLTKIIATIGDQQSSWPYQLERARQRLLKKDINEVSAAIKDLEAIETVHKSSELFYLKAEAHWQLDDWEKARQAFESALKLESKKDVTASFQKALAPLQTNFEENKDFLLMSESFCKQVSEVCHEAANKGIASAQMIDNMVKLLVETEKWCISKNRPNILLNSLKTILKKGVEESDAIQNLLASFEKLQEIYKSAPPVYSNLISIIEQTNFEPINWTYILLSLKLINEEIENPRRILQFIDFFKNDIKILARLHEIKTALASESAFEYFLEYTLYNKTVTEELLDEFILASDRILEARLKAEFPVQAPRIAEAYKDGTLFHAISKLSDQFPRRRDFEYLLEHYVADKKDPTDKLKNLSSLTPKFIQNVLANKHRIFQLQIILQLERERHISLLPIFLEDAARLDGPLVQTLQGNETFSRQIDSTLWKIESYYQVLLEWLRINKATLFNIFDLAHEHQSALQSFLNDQSLQQGAPSTSIAHLFTRITALQADSSQAHLAHAWLDLVERNEKLAFDLLKYNEEYCHRWLEIAACEEFMVLSELIRRSDENPKDLFLPAMLEIIDVSNISLIKYLLKLYKDKVPIDQQDFLIQIAALKPGNVPFSKEFQTAVILHARGEKELMKIWETIMAVPAAKRDSEVRHILSWLNLGHFGLVKEYWNNREKEFWEKTIVLSLDATTMQQLRDFYINLQLLRNPPISMSQATVTSIEQQALKAVQSKSSGELWLKGMLFTMEHQPDQVAKTFSISGEELIEKSKKIITDKLDLPDSLSSLIITLADCLITSEGTINSKLASSIIPILEIALKRLDIPLHVKKELRFLFETVTGDPYFSDRLQACQLPVEGTMQAKLIRAQLDLDPSKPITVRHARIVALSAILSPVFQGNLGSCFSTSVVRQLLSYKDGIKQSFEDFLCLLSQGFLTRTIYDRNQSVKRHFPMSFDEEGFKMHFRKDNFLSRAREFTLASMDKATNYVYTTAMKLIKSLPFPEEDDEISPWETEIVSKLGQEFVKLTAARYLGYIKSSNSDKQGGWVIVDRATEKPLTGNLEIEKLLLKSLQTYATGQGNDLMQYPAIRTLFEETFPKFITSGEFVKKMFGVTQAEFPKTFAFNAKSAPISPLIAFEGGYEKDVIITYHECTSSISRNLPKAVSGHPLERFFRIITRLSPHERTLATSSPYYLKTIGSSDHGMNLRVKPFLNQVKKEENITKLMNEMRKENEELMRFAITPEIKKSILNHFLLQWNAKNSKQLEEPLERAIGKHTPKTVQELCQLLLKTTVSVIPGLETASHTKIKILCALSKIINLKKVFPETYKIIHTNWDIVNGVSYGLDFDAENPIPIFALANGTLLDKSDVVPWLDSEYLYCDFSPITDDISRTYFTP